MSSEPKPYKRPLWPMIVLAVCAAGAGVTGTLLWTQNRAPKTVVAQTPTGVQSNQVSPLADLPPMVQNAPKSQPALPAPPSQVAQPVLSKEPPDLEATPPSQALVGLTQPQAALVSANWFFDHQNWPRAIAAYQIAIKGGIDNPNVRTDLGSSYRFMKQPQQALDQYQIAQKQDPKHETSLFNQGAVYAFSMGQTARGVEIWKQTLKQFPNGINAASARQLIKQAAEGKPGAKLTEKAKA